MEKRLADLRPSLKSESRFADGMTLLGHDLPKTKLKPGETLDVNFYWRAWQEVPLDYVVFLHLRGDKRILNFDHRLDHGRMDMTELTPGQVVREDYRLTIPLDTLPGKYKLVLGLWEPGLASEGVAIVAGAGEGGKDVMVGEIDIR